MQSPEFGYDPFQFLYGEDPFGPFWVPQSSVGQHKRRRAGHGGGGGTQAQPHQQQQLQTQHGHRQGQLVPSSSDWGAMMPFSELGKNRIAVDMTEDEKCFTVVADMPHGIPREKMNVKLSDDNKVLTISAESSQEKEKSDANYHLRERSYGMVSRSLPVPPNIDTAKLAANFDKGVLKITMPKVETQTKSQNVPISELSHVGGGPAKH